MAAMDPKEPARIQALLDFADGERAEELAFAVEDGGVMGVGVDGDDRLHRQKMGGATLLDGKMAGRPARRPSGPAQRPVAALAQVWFRAARRGKRRGGRNRRGDGG